MLRQLKLLLLLLLPISSGYAAVLWPLSQENDVFLLDVLSDKVYPWSTSDLNEGSFQYFNNLKADTVGDNNGNFSDVDLTKLESVSGVWAAFISPSGYHPNIQFSLTTHQLDVVKLNYFIHQNDSCVGKESLIELKMGGSSINVTDTSNSKEPEWQSFTAEIRSDDVISFEMQIGCKGDFILVDRVTVSANAFPTDRTTLPTVTYTTTLPTDPDPSITTTLPTDSAPSDPTTLPTDTDSTTFLTPTDTSTSTSPFLPSSTEKDKDSGAISHNLLSQWLFFFVFLLMIFH